jgi:hypothetical protein
MEGQIARTLLATGRFHVDDLDDLNLPPAAFEVRGTLVNSIRSRGVMESTGVYRKVAHAAANSRKAPIYRITSKGRQELSKLVGVDVNVPRLDQVAVRGVGVDPGESDAGGQGADHLRSHDVGTPVSASPDPLQLDIPESPRLFDFDRPEAA